MAKSIKNKSKKAKKVRSYTVQRIAGVPSIPLRGKYLATDFDLHQGDRVEVIPIQDMFLVRKLSACEVAAQDVLRLRASCEQMIDDYQHQLVLYKEDSIVNVFNHKQLLTKLKACGNNLLTLQVLALHQDKSDKVLKLINDYKTKLANCEQAMYEASNAVLMQIHLPHFIQLLKLLKKCAKQLGLRVLAVKQKSKPTTSQNRLVPQSNGLMSVADGGRNSYSVDAELVNNPERYLQA